jgi:hypothetical protein
MRPTASALLSHRFFRMARDPAFLHEHFLAGLTQQEPLPVGPGQHNRPLGRAGAAGPASAQQGPWAGNGLLSGPSSSGPIRLASAWLFPPVVPGARLSGHSNGHAGDAGQLPGSQAGELGPGQGSDSATCTPAGADTNTAGSSSALEQQLQPFLQQQAALRGCPALGLGLAQARQACA